MLQRPKVKKDAPEFTVVDVETTGFSKQDRIVEIALVRTDSTGTVLDTFESLINPERDVGPTRIHGVSASMVSAAPIFEEVAGSVAGRIDGSVLVAHNLPFDRRMLEAEFMRLGADFVAGDGVCTLSGTGSRLDVACVEYGVDHGSAHCAMDDALAAAQLLFACGVLEERLPISGPRAAVAGVEIRDPLRTLSRQAVGGGEEVSPLVEAARRALLPPGEIPVLLYAEALDRVLLDAVITKEEAALLDELAEELGLAAGDIETVNRTYFANLLMAAERDGVITDEENELLGKISQALGLEVRIPGAAVPASSSLDLVPGMRVCFTGEATDSDGRMIARSELEALAESIGLQIVGGVTKKKCDLLVASDPMSMSGKAKKARQYDKPVISVEEFLRATP